MDEDNVAMLVFVCCFVGAILCACAQITNMTGSEESEQRRASTAPIASNLRNLPTPTSTAPIMDPEEQRRQLVRSCLEFRTISAPPPPRTRGRKKSKKKRRRKKKSGDENNNDDDDDGIEQKSKKKGRKKKKSGDENNKNNNDDDDDDGIEQKSKKKGRKKKKSGDENNNNNNDDDDDGGIEQKSKKKGRRKKKSGDENNNNDDDDGIELVSCILQNNNSITSSIRSLVADILRRGNNHKDYDEEDPPIVAKNYDPGHVISMDTVLDSMRLGGPNVRKTDACSICLEPYAVGDRLARMKQYDDGRPCSGHWFKEDCIMEWLQTHDDCPLSRIRVVYPNEDMGSLTAAPLTE